MLCCPIYVPDMLEVRLGDTFAVIIDAMLYVILVLCYDTIYVGMNVVFAVMLAAGCEVIFADNLAVICDVIFSFI